MTTATKKQNQDYAVADLKLADWGRKEIAHRRDRDARPHGDPRGVRASSSR